MLFAIDWCGDPSFQHVDFIVDAAHEFDLIVSHVATLSRAKAHDKRRLESQTVLLELALLACRKLIFLHMIFVTEQADLIITAALSLLL